MRVGRRARMGFLQAHGRPSFLQRRFHRSIPIRLGSICERCSFGFKRMRRELALPTFVGWRGFLGAMILSQLANGRWSLVRRNRGCRPRDENGREPAAALRWRFQICHGLRPSDDDSEHPAELARGYWRIMGRGGVLVWRGNRRRFLVTDLPEFTGVGVCRYHRSWVSCRIFSGYTT